ncbi:MAG: four helix bundle protein [Alphaproteobacteria bacterium]|nr:four helix bundle protein [Alphaproteobacteria bacterium]
MLAKNLEVFKKSHKFTLQIYEITKAFPREELFGLVSQMRRAAYSINSNIVEGVAKKSSNEYARFILIARGSASELEYQLELAKDLKYITELEFGELLDKINQIGKMLSALHKSIKAQPLSPIPEPL